MAATGALGLAGGVERHLDGSRLCRLAYGVGEREQVVGGGTVLVVVREPKHLPPAGRGEPLAVPVAQVVGVWFGVRREGADYRRHVGVHIGERGGGRASARSARTATKETHGRDATTQPARLTVGSRS